MNYALKEQKALPASQMRLQIQIEAATIESEFSHVLAEAVKEAELPGFRKGKVPVAMVRERMGEMALFEEAATHALSHALSDIFEKEKLDVIGRPSVSATKLAPGNPAEFTVTVALFPKLALPDYKALAAKANKKPEEEVKTEEKEIDAVIAQITKEHEMRTKKSEFKLAEDSVKELGDFASLADMRSKVTEGLTGHKKNRAGEKRRAELLDAITKGTKGDLPEILIEHELNRLEGEFAGQMAQIGGTFDDYLKEIKKDREALRKEWRTDAEKRARLHLALAEIARGEKIIVTEEELNAEMKPILEHYKDAKEDHVRSFVENTILNRKTIAFLEEQK